MAAPAIAFGRWCLRSSNTAVAMLAAGIAGYPEQKSG